MNFKKILQITLGCFAAFSISAQNLSNTPPVLYPEIQVTAAMQQTKNSATPPTGQVVFTNGLPTCTQLTPICTAPGQYYTLTTNANAPQAHQLNPGNLYGCLGSTPNPMWYYIRVDQSGQILMNLNAISDIDYAIWGPFPSVAVAQSICGQYQMPVNCSYSGSNNEFPQIPNGQTGEIYVMLIANFANIVQPATLTQVGGSGSMDCDAFSSINGVVYNDRDSNCLTGINDAGLRGIYLHSTYGYSISDSLGAYSIIADSGAHSVTQIIPAYLLPLVDPSCVGPYSFNFTHNPLDTMGVNFYNDVLECPYLTVDISSNRRRRCFQNSTVVRYCNEGFADATNVEVFVELPQYVNFVSANYPHTVDTNGNYVFNIGNLAMGQCGTINIIDSVSCIAGITGTVQCINAWITPANSCVDDSTAINPNDPWDRSSMSVSGQCVADSVVRFTVTNTGDPGDGDMEGPTEYRIYVDGVLVYTGTLQITGGATYVIEVPATGGVVRLEVDQRPNHPGFSHPNDIVQGCGDTTNTANLNDWLAYNAQTSDDASVTIEEECLPILDSYDPNDKQVYPGGAGVNHVVVPNTMLDYVIRFQNTGNDLAYRVIIRDTLESDLDLSTLQVGVSTHDFDFYIDGTDRPILIFDFKNINLPDSMSDPLGSQGLVKFKIAPYANVPLGTVVENTASIYFDFNEPIVTNTAWVTIDNPVTGPAIDVTIISATESIETALNIEAYPNPTGGILMLNLKEALSEAKIAVYNMSGQALMQTEINNEQFTKVDISSYPAGIYMLQVVSGNKTSVLKVIKR
jgi:hypothetical protein